MTEITSNTTSPEAQQPSAMVRIQTAGGAPRILVVIFSSNLKQFLTERPVKVIANKGDFFKSTSFGAGMGENVKELFHPAPRLQPGAPGSELLEKPGQDFDSFWTNLRDMISPRKLPPLNTTSQPVAVKDIWTKDTQFTRVQYLSLAIHVVVLVLIIVPLLPEILSPPPPRLLLRCRSRRWICHPTLPSCRRVLKRRVVAVVVANTTRFPRAGANCRNFRLLNLPLRR